VTTTSNRKWISASFAGKARVIVDGDNQGATEHNATFSGSFERTIEFRDLDAPENRGEGSAQQTPDPTAPAGD
jgi:hypothetical protein